MEYRTSLMALHKQQLVELEEKKFLERQRMEDRLDQLRSTVRKEASSDLDRTFGNTEASHHMPCHGYSTYFSHSVHFNRPVRPVLRLGMT